MGKTQSDLLAQCRKELEESNSESKNDTLKKNLVWPDIPKDIPIYKKPQSPNKTAKIVNWKPKKESSFVRLRNKMHSLLKINSDKDSNSVKNGIIEKKQAAGAVIDKSKIKIVFNKNGDESILRHTKRMQSVLKCKSNIKDDKNFNFGKERNPEKENLQVEFHDLSSDNELKCSSPSSGSTSTDSKRKGSPNSCEVLSDDTDCTEIIPVHSPTTSSSRSASTSPKPNQKKYEAKILTRKVKSNFKSVMKGESELVKSRLSNELHKISSSHTFRSSFIRSPRRDLLASDESGPAWTSLEEAGQHRFLGYFGLISKAQFDALKRKRCERKRRSVAGQSSLYNDYFQPPTPKRTYAPRKPVSVPTSPNNNQVTVETAMELEDEDEKPIKSEQNCIICNQTGLLEACHSCSDMYHFKCLQNPSNGCPTCNAQPSNIKNIVGANSVSSASSTELIKRYLAPANDVTNEPVQTDKPKCGSSGVDV